MILRHTLESLRNETNQQYVNHVIALLFEVVTASELDNRIEEAQMGYAPESAGWQGYHQAYQAFLRFMNGCDKTWWFLPLPMLEKHLFMSRNDDFSYHPALHGILRCDLTLPEIQAQIARTMKQGASYKPDEHDDIYRRFLEATYAPEGIERRYAGEPWLLMYASAEHLAAKGIYPVNVRNWGEDRSVAPSKYNQPYNDLQHAHIRYVRTWESELPNDVLHAGPFRVIEE